MGWRWERERRAAKSRPWLWALFTAIGGFNLFRGASRLDEWWGVLLAVVGGLVLVLGLMTLYLSRSAET